MRMNLIHEFPFRRDDLLQQLGEAQAERRRAARTTRPSAREQPHRFMFVRLRLGTARRAEIGAFFRWLDADPRHADEMLRRQLAWELLGELERDPEIARLTREAEASLQARAVARRWRRACYAAAAVLVVAVAAGLWWTGSAADRTVLETDIGEQKRISLADGSQVVLNMSTRLDIELSRDVRRVRLERGEATFKVARETDRPFEVVRGDAVVRALGTEFNVMSVSNEVSVDVLEGRVQLRADTGPHAGQAVVLSAGEAARFTPASGIGPVTRADVDRISAWHARRIELDDAPLAVLVAESNRYSETPIVIGDPELSDVRISGVFRAGDVDALTEALHEALGIRADRAAGRIVLRAPAAKEE